MDGQEFDYVIVGAGSAGCVLASRLTEDDVTVGLLEAGGSDRSVLIQMPSALSIPMNMAKYNWSYESEPEPALGGRRINTPRGRVIGGSSSINGMVYVRGHALDFDRWEQEGAEGWGYRHVLPYFRRAETRQAGGDQYRGDAGPLHTRTGALDNPLHAIWLQAAQQAGYPASSDINGEQQEGFGRLDMTVHQGRRWSAANAYLRPALSGPALSGPALSAPALSHQRITVLTHALATSIVFAGRRAVGVRYRRDGGEHVARARREVILCGGPINSPQLLKLSGVGPAGELAAHGIAVLHDLPGVGENLQDHLEFYFQVACTKPVSLYPATRPLARARIGLRWLLRKDGLGATNHFESCGFIRSRAGVRHPDIQYHFLPLAVSYDGKSLADGHGFQAHVGPMRSKSRGSVRLRSADPADKPRIRFNYMSHPNDWTEMRACVRLTREIFAQAAFDGVRGREIQPGTEVRDDDAIDGFIRDKAESAYHPSCSCRMGRRDDPMAVVDSLTRVIGLEALRVVDSSIMPSITTGNLNAPTIMIGEKAADLIRGRAPLAASNAPVPQAADWMAAQR